VIIFLEGLPRSGKSHTAVKDYIVPALQKGRMVFAHINGLDHEKISAYSGVPLDKCKELLIPIAKEQVKEWYKHVKNDAMVLLDEMQDFWPVARDAMDQDSTEAITQHGHRGLDIVGMGQVLKDVHATWRRRVDRKYVFVKKDVLGKDDEYQWSAYKHVGNEKFEQITKGSAKYDPAIFGCYASHKEDVENKGVFEDKRAVIWNNPLFKKWIPIYALAAFVGISVVVYAFKGGIAKSGAANAPPVPQPVAAAPVVPATPPKPPVAAPVAPVAAPVVAAVKEEPKPVNVPIPEPPDLIDTYSKTYRLRLAGFIRMAGGESRGFLEWRGMDNSVVDRMTFRQISALGWVVMLSQDGNMATINKGSMRYAAMPWPVSDYSGRSTDSRQESLKPM
jgi:zona occludens toxin